MRYDLVVFTPMVIKMLPLAMGLTVKFQLTLILVISLFPV